MSSATPSSSVLVPESALLQVLASLNNSSTDDLSLPLHPFPFLSPSLKSVCLLGDPANSLRDREAAGRRRRRRRAILFVGNDLHIIIITNSIYFHGGISLCFLLCFTAKFG